MPPAEVLCAKVLSLEAEVADLQARVAWFQRQMFAGSRSEKLPIESAAQTKLGLAEVPQSQQAAKTQTVSDERRAPAPQKRPQPAEVFAQLPVHEIVEIIPNEFSNGFDRLLGVQGYLIQADQGAFRISSGFKHVTSANFRKSRS